MLASSPGDGSEKVKKGRGAVRKRLYSLEHRLQVVKETLEPGASVSIVARRHDINSNVVFRWRKLFREGRLGSPAGAVPQLPSPDFVPIHIVRDAPAGTACSPPVGGRGAMELVLHGGFLLRMNADVDDAALRRVLRVVMDLA